MDDPRGGRNIGQSLAQTMATMRAKVFRLYVSAPLATGRSGAADIRVRIFHFRHLAFGELHKRHFARRFRRKPVLHFIAIFRRFAALVVRFAQGQHDLVVVHSHDGVLLLIAFSPVQAVDPYIGPMRNAFQIEDRP